MNISKKRFSNFKSRKKTTRGIFGTRFNFAQISPFLVSASNLNQAPRFAIKSAQKILFFAGLSIF